MTLQGSNGIDNEIARLNNLGAKFADGTKTEKGRSRLNNPSQSKYGRILSDVKFQKSRK